MSEGVVRLRAIVAKLRSPEGCPWDREQTHSSLRAGLLEECYEVIEAIDREDDLNLCEELGDMLLHIVMHAQLAAERGAFSFDVLVDGVCEKMVRRHPHVFGDEPVAVVSTEAVLRQWEAIKRQEKGSRVDERAGSLFDELSCVLPALLRAQKVQRKVARMGFDWSDIGPVFEKLLEEKEELCAAIESRKDGAVFEEVGDLLFTIVNLARKVGVDAELALLASTRKFVGRFEQVEVAVAQSGKRVEECSLEELDVYWNRVKELTGGILPKGGAASFVESSGVDV